MKKRTSLIRIIRTWGVVFLLGLSISIVSIDIIASYHDLNFRVDRIRTDYIDRQKQIIKQEVKRVVDMAAYEKAQTERVTRNKIKSRVYEADSIAQNIYQKYQQIKSPVEIQHIILEALRPIRFENDTGYYFATHLGGVELLFADRPEMEGLNLLELRDTRGQYVIKDMIEIARTSGEGFYDYYWTKPESEGNDFKKISFIKLFSPLKGFIGTGLYVDDIEREIKSNLLSAISRIRFEKEGYIFVNKFNGDALVSNGKVFSGTKKLWEVFNDNPEKMKNIFQMEYDAATTAEGDYIHYSHIKLTSSNKESPKVSFIYGIPELQWIIGAGFYLDDVETNIVLMQEALNNQIKTKIFYFIFIVTAVVGLFFLLFNWLSNKLKNDISLIVSFFKKATHSDETINRENIKFVELDQMAEYANKMLRDRKQSAAALVDSERKWHNILITTPQIGISLTPEAKIVFANEHFQKLTGWTEDEIIGQDWFEMFIPEKISDEIRRVFKTVISRKDNSGFFNNENDIITKDGELRHIAWSNVLTKDDEDQVMDVTCLGVDLTERIASEKLLAESEDKYRSIMESMTDAVYICSPDYKITYMNPAMIRRVGRDATGESCFRALHGLNERCQWCSFTEIKKGNSIETSISSPKDGRHYRVNNMPIHNKDGSVSKLTIYRDITDYLTAISEKDKVTAQLQQAQKLESIGTLAGGIAHDFNNILSSIFGYTELALIDVKKGSSLEASLQEILSAAKRARDLVKQILAFARQSDEERRPMRVDTIAKEVSKLIRSTIPSTIEVTENINSTSLIMGNSSQVHQIFMNLCTNAAQSMEDAGGVLNIGLEEIVIDHQLPPQLSGLKSGEYIKISISDSGPGIPPDIIGSIFEPYFTTKAIGEGTGMGLALTHGIVESYEGTITVDSKLGKGTIFSIYLPITKKIEGHLRQEDGKLPSGTESVLLVDDELPIAKISSEILQRLGYRVTIRTSSVEALALFRSKPDGFDLVITDMTMPNMTGDELAMQLIALRSDIPVILCTGYSKKISEEIAKDIGIKAFVYKPIVRADFAKTIRKVLDEMKGASLTLP